MSQPSNPLLGPGLEPPPGEVPDFDHPGQTQQPVIIGVVVTCLVLVSIFVPLRLYTKLFIIKKLRLEDCKYTLIRFVLAGALVDSWSSFVFCLLGELIDCSENLED